MGQEMLVIREKNGVRTKMDNSELNIKEYFI